MTPNNPQPEKAARIEIHGCVSFEGFKNHARRDNANPGEAKVILTDGTKITASRRANPKETTP